MAVPGQSGDTRERILESAMELMHERGYESVGVAEICKLANVNKGSFYHFFRTKENLGLCVIDRYWENMSGQFQVLADRGASLPELGQFIASMAEHHRLGKADHGCVRGCLLGNLALEMAPRAPAVQQRLQSIFDEQIAVLAGLIRRAVAAGDLPPQDALQSANNIIAFLEGVAMISKVRNDPEVFASAEPAVLGLVGLAPGG